MVQGIGCTEYITHLMLVANQLLFWYVSACKVYVSPVQQGAKTRNIHLMEGYDTFSSSDVSL